MTKQEYWGLKGLAFKVKKNRKAHYAFFNIDSPPAAVAEMERLMGINPDVIRFLTVRVEALEAEPSIQMRKRIAKNAATVVIVAAWWRRRWPWRLRRRRWPWRLRRRWWWWRPRRRLDLPSQTSA